MNSERILDRCGLRRFGIGKASVYLKSMEPFAEDKAAFALMLKEADAKLVYCDGRTRIDEDTILKGERLKEPDNLTPGAVMTFEATITATMQDRDGDMLETKGCRPDLLGPLLWNHMVNEPIGRPLETTVHNTKRYAERLAIINNPLGRDVAQLIEFGALRRMSHGFLPGEGEDDVSEIVGEDGKFVGWHVKVYDMLERSVVSVASCVDALIGAFANGKFCTPMIKGWTGRLYQARPVVVQGITMQKAADPAVDHAVPEIEEKPYANEHAARLRDPDDFVRIRQLWPSQVAAGDSYPYTSEGVRAIGGPLKSDPDGGTVEQAIRFKASQVTPAEAKQWLDDHDYTGYTFEEAASQAATPVLKGTVPADPPDGGGVGVDGEWTKLRLSDFTDKLWADLSAAEQKRIASHFAWYADLDTFDSLKLGHHFPDGGRASLNGVRNALARANQVDGIGGDLERVTSHLRAHLPERAVSESSSPEEQNRGKDGRRGNPIRGLLGIFGGRVRRIR